MQNKVKTERAGNPLAPLLEKARGLPEKPGCYLMKDQKGRVLYVGKAKKLKARVSSYFQNSAKTPKTEILVSHIRDFDFLLTENETEAFILENNLIKKYTPKYNIMMRDDKSYPYIIVDHNEPFPRLRYERKVKRGAKKEVFGPFVVGSNIGEVLRIVVKSFQLRDCSLREMRSRKRPCLLYQIKQCSAPCVDYISEESYSADLEMALNLFRGRPKRSLEILRERMMESASNEEFEHAAILRDNIDILEAFLSKATQENAEFTGKDANVDVIAYYQGEVEVDLSIYMVRNSILLGHKNFNFPVVECDDDIESEVLKFLYQYYSSGHDTYPKAIYCDFRIENIELLKLSLESFASIQVKRGRGQFKSLLELTKEQAFEHQRVRLNNQDSYFFGLNKLKELLGLKERPITLECYDIAIFQGSSPAASQVVFINGKPEKKRYRYYKLEERPEGNNDFAMMKEVLRRRIKHGDLPDVFVVDGGKGQVSSFQEVLREMDIDLPVVGIAKAKTQKESRSEERLIIPGRLNPYLLHKNRGLLRIIVNMRDEAHRFSRKLHHKMEGKKLFHSWLDQVEGIGPGLKKKILNRLTLSKEELGKLSVEEIQQLFDINKKVANGIWNQLN
jgi:excinuclease ABC subunit C